MRIKLVYPTWQRIQYQTHYVLPPLGITVVAALTPPGHDVTVTDENVDSIDFDEPVDLVGIGTMLVSQAPRAFAIADEFRARGVKVVLGGLTVTCLPEESARHADAVVLGEAEEVWPKVVADAQAGRLERVYRRPAYAEASSIPVARRDLLDHAKYTYRGVRMMDLIETSRGCRFACMPCQVPHVSGKGHRIRPIESVVKEMAALECERMFIVDSSLEQNEDHERALFSAMRGLGKAWVSHPISVRPDILKLAADSGCWYVYHSIHRIGAVIRDRVKMLQDYGIGVQGTVSVGYDYDTLDTIKRRVDFLLEIGLELAEFTILTPFPGTPYFEKMKKDGRLLHEDWSRYNAENVVFRPARMTVAELEKGYQMLWEGFYSQESQPARMARLYRRLTDRAGWRASVGEPETRVIPNQQAGIGALWGGVTRKA